MHASAMIGAIAMPIRPIIFAEGQFRNGSWGLYQQAPAISCPSGNQSGKVRFAPLKNSISAA
ncbi:hypothetical protein DXT95_17075 [Agrobacterium tumefaciens]|nr:hypothetical protein [Agrobacterium tumefaciens]